MSERKRLNISQNLLATRNSQLATHGVQLLDDSSLFHSN